MSNLQQAREWANRHDRIRDVFHPDAKAAVEVIQSLPDKWVDVEKVREVISGQLSEYPRGTVGHCVAEEIARDLEPLLTPKLPTLADMTAEERKACRWKQCRAKGFSEDERLVIAYVDDHWITLWREAGHSIRTNPGAVTPLPDLPKLQWPGSGGAPTIAQKERVADDQAVAKDVCNKLRPEDVPADEIWLDPQENFDASVEYVKTILSSPEPKEDEVWIAAPGIVEQLMRAHHKIVTELQAEIKTLKFDLSMATSAGDLAEKDLSDVQDELAHANVQVERAERELVDAKKKLFKEDQQVESLIEQIADMVTDLLQLKQGVREAMAGSEGSYALMMEAFRKIRFLVASDKTYVPEGPAIPAEKLFLNGNLKLVAGRSGAGVVLEDSQGRCIKITANKLKPLGEYLLAVHYFNEAGGNDNV